MNRIPLVFAMVATTLGTATMARAQTAIASDESPFRFNFEQSNGPRGLAVEGYIYNALPWRITNVRLQVDSIDENGTVVASASGWVLGNVAAGGRGYFYVPVSAKAGTYRPSVQDFDKVMREAPAPQAREAEGWGRHPFWTHFDGYLIRTGAGEIRLQALAGGDVRYGGVYDLLAVGREYDSDRLLARFAVVQRARMVAS